MFAISHFSVFRSSPVARGCLNPPAGIPGPTHKQKIVRAFFQKRAIELQTAATLDAPNFLYCAQTCDNDVTGVTKFPFTGGQLGARCRETQVMGERPSHVVGTSQVPNSVDKRVARKFWVDR